MFACLVNLTAHFSDDNIDIFVLFARLYLTFSNQSEGEDLPVHSPSPVLISLSLSRASAAKKMGFYPSWNLHQSVQPCNSPDKKLTFA